MPDPADMTLSSHACSDATALWLQPAATVEASCLLAAEAAAGHAEVMSFIHTHVHPTPCPSSANPHCCVTSQTPSPSQSLVTTIDSHHILAADNAAGRALIKAAEADEQLAHGWAEAGAKLRVTYVPDQLCANVLRIGRHVVMQQGVGKCGERRACQGASLTGN